VILGVAGGGASEEQGEGAGGLFALVLSLPINPDGEVRLSFPHGGGHCPGGFRPPRLSGGHFAGVYGRDAHRRLLYGEPGGWRS
jgi:hypothetical protein